MRFTASVRLDTSVLDGIVSALPKRTNEILRRGAFAVEADAKGMAPVDTGALRNSIHTEEQSPFMYFVMDGVHYGVYQEFGTYKMRAQPFMTPAVEKNREAILSSFRGLFT